MKKYFILFTLMLLVFNYSYSVSKIMPENDWKVKNLKGKVKSMVKIEYEYDSSGKIEKTWVTETYFNEQGYITDEVQYVDNENFPLLEKITYNKNGKKVHHLVYSGKELITNDTYIYNEKGNLIEIKQAVSTDVKDNRLRKSGIKITYNYKANGDYEKTTEVATAKWTYLYDKNGNEQEYISMIKTGSEGKTKISIYLKFKDITRDEHGNLTRSTSVRYDYSKKKESSIYKKLENKYEYYK